MAESSWRKRLRSLRMRHLSPSCSALASFSANALVKTSAAARPMPPRVLTAHGRKEVVVARLGCLGLLLYLCLFGEIGRRLGASCYHERQRAVTKWYRRDNSVWS